MEVKCINPKCLHRWNYRGQSKNYICCSKCGYRFKLQRGIENHVNIPHNIPSNIPHNIVKTPYKKTIKEPKKEFVGEIAPTSKPHIKAPKEKVMAVEVSDPMAKDGKRIVMKKYKELTSHLGRVEEIKSNPHITEIPFDSIAHLNHAKNY